MLFCDVAIVKLCRNSRANRMALPPLGRIYAIDLFMVYILYYICGANRRPFPCMTTSADILAHRAKQLAPCNCIVTSLKRDQKEQKGGHI